LDIWFKPNPAIDLQSHLGQSVGIFSGAEPEVYVIRLSAQAARWAQEDPWHAQQTLEPQDDGRVLLTVTAYHDMEIIQRVLRLGVEAEILSPEHCRQEMQRTVEALAEVYRQKVEQ
jgi:predicted DNA-binding transcriptional regulator YafY